MHLDGSNTAELRFDHLLEIRRSQRVAFVSSEPTLVPRSLLIVRSLQRIFRLIANRENSSVWLNQMVCFAPDALKLLLVLCLIPIGIAPRAVHFLVAKLCSFVAIRKTIACR
jgi:hypothetical protein